MEYISFCFDQLNERYISPAHAKQIMDWLAGVECIGEFVNEPVETINEVCKLINLHMVQLKGNYTSEDVAKIEVPVVWETEENVPAPDGVFAIQMNYKSGMPVSTQTAKTIIHFADETEKTIKDVIQTHRPFAISFTGGDEDKPGLRDFSALSEVLDALAVED
ncbi:MAG: hypothetical protein IT247_03235 [Bacteroidia bacterium]|nr:hypothetical protein [Bacteroidia bacterium]